MTKERPILFSGADGARLRAGDGKLVGEGSQADRGGRMTSSAYCFIPHRPRVNAPCLFDGVPLKCSAFVVSDHALQYDSSESTPSSFPLRGRQFPVCVEGLIGEVDRHTPRVLRQIGGLVLEGPSEEEITAGFRDTRPYSAIGKYGHEDIRKFSETSAPAFVNCHIALPSFRRIVA